MRDVFFFLMSITRFRKLFAVDFVGQSKLIVLLVRFSLTPSPEAGGAFPEMLLPLSNESILSQFAMYYFKFGKDLPCTQNA